MVASIQIALDMNIFWLFTNIIIIIKWSAIYCLMFVVRFGACRAVRLKTDTNLNGWRRSRWWRRRWWKWKWTIYVYLRMNSISGMNTLHQMRMCDHITSVRNKSKSISFNNPSDVIDPTTIVRRFATVVYLLKQTIERHIVFVLSWDSERGRKRESEARK